MPIAGRNNWRGISNDASMIARTRHGYETEELKKSSSPVLS
jgi:hypothetical protein